MSEMQKDLVLSINEFAYVLDKTKGNVSCWVGPAKTSLSTSDELVCFNPNSKTFEPCSYSEAIHIFTTAPENWYVILKNPAKDNRHPTPGTSNNLPENICVGRKINIRGPETFALYPGQMARVIKGHTLRSNQYLLARVYEADSASISEGEMLDAEGNKIKNDLHYVNGQILVIKGTEVSFYIPPTGIEVIPIENNSAKGFARDAVTLERLEYCILKDEDGNKRYVHGPEVVFPQPTEQFVISPKGGFIFKAIELSKISGVYVKVIAEYTDTDDENNKTIHPVGEELFITGDNQMIYYPRPEHAIINYDGKIVHHAIAIPSGEGRYVMNRLSGEIRTVRGPAMYLPDPRYEVVVKRKLTEKQCDLWYPGNREAAYYNANLTERSVEKSLTANIDDVINTSYCASNSITDSLAFLEAKANISRGTSYTKPRTITLDNKYDGVVSIDVWTGYSVNVVSKDGTRKIVSGPTTVLLDYDQTLEVLELSTGKPKTTDTLIKTVYLRHENNKISDIITVETKDFVHATIKLSYCVNFDEQLRDKWFDVENYTKYLCDRERSLIARAVKTYNIEEFYQNYADIVRNIAINNSSNTNSEETDKAHIRRFFKENGMYVHDCEVLGLSIEDEVAELLEEHQSDMIRQSLELSDAEKSIKVAEELAKAEKRKSELSNEASMFKMELQKTEAAYKLDMQSAINRRKEAEILAAKQAENDVQVLIDAIQEAELLRIKKSKEAELAQEKALADLAAARQAAYADTIAQIMSSIDSKLVAAMTSKANADTLAAIAQSISPYAIAGDGESVSDVVTKLLHGTPLDQVVKDINLNV